MALIKKAVTENSDHRKAAKATIDITKQHAEKKSILAVDIGFGYNKGKTEDCEFAIASLITQVASLDELQVDEKAAIVDSIIVEHEDKIYLVGTLAARFNRQVARSTFRERSIDENFPVLYKASIVAAYDGYSDLQLQVVTGLPNSDLEQQEDLHSLIGSIQEVVYYKQGKRYAIDITYQNISIVSQTDGGYSELMYSDELELTIPQNENGERMTKIGILDFGQGTTNASIYEGGNKVGIGSRTCSLPGVHSIYERIGMMLRDQFQPYEPTHLDIEGALVHKAVKVKGSQYNVADPVASIIEIFSTEIFQTIFEKWKNELDSMQAIFIIGGGSNLILEPLTRVFEKKAKYTHIYYAEEAQMLNVRGYFKYGRLLPCQE